MKELRQLPSVDTLIQSPPFQALMDKFGRTLTLQAVRTSLDEFRKTILAGADAPSAAQILQATSQILERWFLSSLHPVINATGVIIHTNLGRVPLSQAALDAVTAVSAGYSNLEYSLQEGKRGKRDQHAESMLCRLTGAEAALVVNNNAAAVMLALSGIAQHREVLISRSQLIEIGGGFRIPDILKASGAHLVEVGTTNRTYIQDFEEAFNPQTAAILRVHQSNFRMLGFTTEPSIKELADLGQRLNIPVIDDLGSGVLLDTTEFGLVHEPTIQESLQAGVPLVSFSGDKLLGGPQAGILVGEKSWIDKLRKHPTARAFRPDKMCLAALVATLQHYLKGEATQAIPIWRMLASSADDINTRAIQWQNQLGCGTITAGRSTIGGGSLPEETLPTWLFTLDVLHPNAFTRRLRELQPAIIARVEEGHVVLDPRTVLPFQESDLLTGLQTVLEES